MHSELERTLADLDSDYQQCQSDLNRQKELNDRLEQDLLQIHRPNGINKPGDLSPLASGDNDDPLAALNLGKEPAVEQAESHATGTSQFKSSAETSILPIVTNQRDRFRQRNTELEEVSSLEEYKVLLIFDLIGVTQASKPHF